MKQYLEWGVIFVFTLFIGWVGSLVIVSQRPESSISQVITTHTPIATTSAVVETVTEIIEAITPEPPLVLADYVEVTDSCGPYFDGECLNIRSGPGSEFPVVTRVRNGVVLKVAETVENNDTKWYRVVFDEWLRYPERVTTELYISSDYVTPFKNEGMQELKYGEQPTTTKRIIVDRSEQTLYAYDGEELFMEEKISAGLELTPTPRGVFNVFKKTPSRYMQGPIPGISTKEYDLPGVPWNLYFTSDGAVIHGAYWHDHFGQQWSNGCVNLPPEKAKELYDWAVLGMTVTIRD